MLILWKQIGRSRRQLVMLALVSVCFSSCISGGRAERYVKCQTEILSQVVDYESAREAALELNELKKGTQELRLPSWDPRMEALDALYKHLAAEYYYGCASLASALGKDWFDAVLPSPLSAEEMEQMKLAAMEKIKGSRELRKRADIDGGPGFSMEEAWVLRAHQYAGVYDVAARIAMKTVSAESLSYTVREAEVEDRRYLVFPITLRMGNMKHLVEQWVDYTEVKETQPEEEKNAAMQELRNRHMQVFELLMSVQDTASAEAAMAEIQPLIMSREAAKLRRAAKTSYNLWGFFSILLTENQQEAYSAKEKEIEQADYYGVEALRELLYVPPWGRQE